MRKASLSRPVSGCGVAYVGAWEFTGDGRPPVLHKEDLNYEFVHMKQRSYK